MSRHVVYLSPIAAEQFERICDYLEKEWSVKSQKEFIKRLDKKIEHISHYPKSCPESGILPGVRKAVVNRQSSFLYRLHKSEIEIITIYDNRQSSETIKENM